MQVNPKELRAASDGKAPLEYLEPALDVPLAHVMKHGADKYGVRNYTVTPIKVRTYIGAIARHLHAIRLSEDIDPDSGQSHWAHIAACCAVVLAAEGAGSLVDDRHGFATALSDRVHEDGDIDAKAITPAQAAIYNNVRFPPARDELDLLAAEFGDPHEFTNMFFEPYDTDLETP